MAEKGNTNAKRGTAWRDAIRKATIQGKFKLEALAEKVVEMAAEGDIQAIREVGDRLDGKALQSVETSKADPFEGMTIEDIERELRERFGVPETQATVAEGKRQTH